MTTEANETPGEPTAPPSNDSSSGESGPQTHQEAPTGLSAVSDSVSLHQDVAQAYEGFDPTVHAVKPDGSPVMTKGGGYARKRGRKPGTTATQKPAGQATTQEKPAQKITNEQAANLILACTQGICCAVFADQAWRMEKDEFLGHRQAVQGYLEATGGFDLSPGWILAASGVMYALPRMESVPTKTRLQKFFGWIASKFSRGK